MPSRSQGRSHYRDLRELNQNLPPPHSRTTPHCLKASYTPGQGEKLPAGTSLEKVAVDCASFKELTCEDARYVFRICEAANSKEFDPQNLYWRDNIFLERFTNPDAGKNRNHLVIGNALKRGTDQGQAQRHPPGGTQ
ncbi:hypothetical protein SAMN05216198_3029 [Halopseudomonas litoralis]|uniref:Uncharacterized protein n=1 Tax=Halopseudomonas litoralis TaxID=797277 RepID=A0A1H1VS39_9GAMM|nr:hypothetical protein [Halopseudomonas litoralis]SDS87778.1 hypothetical protein SAMN05216198_3029 [Halopseudomonas litoralis]